MGRLLLILALLGAVASGAEKAKTIDGEEVLPGPSFTAAPLADIGGLRFYTAKLKRNEADCTIITGTLLSHAPHQNYVFTIELDFYETRANASGQGTARIEVDRPVPGKPVRFQGLGPAWFAARARGEDKRPIFAHYTLRCSVRPYRPPKLDKPPKGEDAPQE